MRPTVEQIRQDLAAAYPAARFSITTRTFSNGDTELTVAWRGGPDMRSVLRRLPPCQEALEPDRYTIVHCIRRPARTKVRHA